MIFTITAYPYGHSDLHKHDFPRVFGYYLTQQQAIDAVINDKTGMDESGYYTHMVIEAVPPGAYAMASVVCWFEWKEDQWKRCAPPKDMNHICNHAMG